MSSPAQSTPAPSQHFIDQVLSGAQEGVELALPPAFQGVFDFHPATPATGAVHDAVRQVVREAAGKLAQLVPQSDELTTALEHLRQAMHYANSGVAVRMEHADS